MSDTNTHTMPQADSTDVEIETAETVYKTTHTAVRKARRFAVQGLYEWLMTDRRFEQNGHNEWKANPPHDIVARTRATNAMHTVHLGYYHEMMRDIPKQIDELDELIASQLDRDVSRLDMIEHAILLIGAYELKHSLHIPYKIVFDEAMKLNTHFGGTDGHKLINAVLDRLAKVLRVDEVAVDKKSDDKKSDRKESSVKKVSQQEPNVSDANDVKVGDKDEVKKETKSGKKRLTRNLVPKTEAEPKAKAEHKAEANPKAESPSTTDKP